ncbi:MAG: 50S ribosomal protein L6 [Ignavibacteriales bacterium]|nr:50S ribosomal protein L6 [Ignavibacteriales bacterium]
MSRIGRKPVVVPSGVTVTSSNGVVTVKGKLGELKEKLHSRITVEVKGNEILVHRVSDARPDRALHGTTRANIQNMVKGVTEGFSKKLELVGVGYKAEIKGKNLALALGFSHSIIFRAPETIKVEAPTQTSILVSGSDRQLVGLVAAKLRSFKQPEPYKGKGVKYENEYIRRKAGKTAASAK